MRRKTVLLRFLLTLLLALPAFAQQDVITTTIGGGPSDMPAIDANLDNTGFVAVDSVGNYYIAGYGQNRIFKVNTTGLLTVIAGNGLPGYSGDGVAGGATSAMLNGPNSMTVDSAENVFIADYNNCVIRKVDTTNTITTIAGTQGQCGGATNLLAYPSDVKVDISGNLFIADTGDCQIKKFVPSTSTMTVVAGTGTCGYSGNGGLATKAELNQPTSIALDSSDDIFITDTYNFVVREVVASSGDIKLVAGDNVDGFAGDKGTATKAEISYAYGITVNSAGTQVTFDDSNNFRVRQFTVGGTINTVAGDGSGGFCGDGGLATSACLYYPEGIAASGTTFYVADNSNERVRTFTVGGDINTVAGNGSTTEATVVNGVAPTGVTLYYPYGVYEDPSGNVYVADQYNQDIRELVAASDVVNTFAGDGIAGFSGDAGPATSAELNYPLATARDSSGNIYIADTSNCLIRVVNTAGTISTFAGNPNLSCGYSGDGGPATGAQLYFPYGVYVDSKNNVYISDTYNHVVREVTNGTINTIAGIPGVNGYAGDGGPAIDAKLFYPAAVAEDGAGNIYIADSQNNRLREISAATGNISTVAGNGVCNFSGDGIAVENSLCYPEGVSADVNGNLFIADQENNRLRWVSSSGIMTTFAGNGTAGYSGDGGLATNAELYYPSGIWEDASGDFLVADAYNYRIRTITAFSALNTSAGSLSFPLESVGATTPAQPLTLSAVGPLTINNISISGPFTESDDCPSTLANAATCTMYVYFAPKASGVQTGTLTINDNGFFNNVSTVALSGTATAISLTGAPIAFGNVTVKTTSAAKTVTLKNTGTAAITMGAITLDETTDFAISANTCPASGATLAGGKSCTISVTFSPKTTGAKKGAIIVNDSDPTSPQIIGLSGTGSSGVALTPASITFPTTAVGTTSAVSKITLTNSTTATVTLSTPAVTVIGPFVIASATTCTSGAVIAPKGTCIIDVEFQPTAVGYASGLVSVADSDATSPQTAALSGTGTAIGFTPTSVNFGIVTTGTQVSSTVSLTNSGTTAVTIIGYDMDGPNSPDFSYSAPCGSSIAAGQTCQLTMYFTPSISGAEKATFKVFDNSPGSPQTLQLTGTGQ